MSQFFGSTFHKVLIEQLKKSSRSITIISPYVTQPAVKELIKGLPSSVKKRSLITVPPGVEYVNGSVDVAALELLHQHGFEVRWLKDLHAKIYLLDEKVAFVGSANFTSRGWELEQKGNVEDMIMIETSKKDRDHINSRYIATSKMLDLNGEWKKDVEKVKATFLKQYQKLIDSIKIIFSDQVVSMYADYQSPPNGYKYHFRFTVSKSTGLKIRNEKSNIHLKLGGEKQAPHAMLIIPFSKFGKYLTQKYSTDKREDWQFRLYIDEAQGITLKIKEAVIPISNHDLSGVLSVEFRKVRL